MTTRRPSPPIAPTIRSHVSARNGLGRTLVARGRNRHRQAHRGWPRGHDRRTLRKSTHLSGDHHLARRIERKQGSAARHHRSRSDLRRPRRQEHAEDRYDRAGRGRGACRATGPAAIAPLDPPARLRPAGEDGGLDHRSPKDAFDEEDDMENSVSLSAMEAELKPKVLDTFERIADPTKSSGACRIKMS